MTPKKGKISPLKQAIYFLEGGAIVPTHSLIMPLETLIILQYSIGTHAPVNF